MSLDKLRIMQQIQIALVEKGLVVSVTHHPNHLFSHIDVHTRELYSVDSFSDRSATEAELQLWHDTIVYGPQVTNNEE